MMEMEFGVPQSPSVFLDLELLLELDDLHDNLESFDPYVGPALVIYFGLSKIFENFKYFLAIIFFSSF